MNLTRRQFTAATLAWMAASRASGQAPEANYDERRVPRYRLPPLLRFEGGGAVRTPAAWNRRRHELIEAFSQSVYGRSPTASLETRVVAYETDVPALGGRARRSQLSLEWQAPGVPARSVDVLVYAPRDTPAPVPVFVGLNFFGNHSVHADPGIRLSTRWMRSSEQHFIHNHRATERSRGTLASRWPLDEILGAGCAVMTAYYGDFAPDDPAHVAEGIGPLFDDEVRGVPEAERWGAIGMWAWGLSRMRECIPNIGDLDPQRAIVIGHSRLGKAALWAAAQDTAFAMAVSNESGCGGAALSRRAFGETVARITTSFPHWFCPNFATFGNRESDLPVDQHQLLALLAPRALYVASAVEDRWADPRGEFLATREADAVYRFLSVPGLGTRSMPDLDTPVGQTVRYHVRTGGHDLTTYDWRQYLRAAREQLPPAA
jgi:hypothetical protein